MLTLEGSEPSSRRGVRVLISVDAAAVALLVVASVVYLSRAITLASTAPFWMDEVLSVWTASQPSVDEVWSALKGGAEFTPPAFDLLLHGLRELGFTSPLAMRAPSIAAVLVAAAGVFALVRHRATTPLAALACAAVLGGALFAYAVQARPYACSTAAMTCAVVAWDRHAPGRALGQAVVVGGLCALAIAFHFYAVIHVGLLALAEVSRGAAGGSLRPRLLAAIALGAASILFWWPIAHAAAAWNAANSSASAFYARPTAARLLMSYASLLLPLAPAFLIEAIVLLLLKATSRLRASSVEKGSAITWIGGAASLVPLVVFTFALAVTHAFSERYVITAALGFAVLLSSFLRPLGEMADFTALGLLVLVTAATPPGGQVANQARTAALSLAAAAPGDLPMATGDGLRYFEILGNAPPATTTRLVFLRVEDPPGGGDPTNRHQVERWSALRPSLQVRDAAAFLCETPRFLMFHDPAGGRDDLPGFLSEAANVRWLQREGEGLALVEPRSCATRVGEEKP